MLQSIKSPRLHKVNSMPKSMLFTLVVLFMFALVGSFKSAATHAYAVSPNSIKSGISGNCLDVMNNSSALGAAVNNYPCNGSDAQNWTVNTVTIKHAGLCLSVANDSAKAGSKISLASCDQAPGQVWLADHGDLYNPNARLCLVDPQNELSKQLALGSCSSGQGAQWQSPMLTLSCSNISGRGAKVACYAESDWETWQSGNVSHEQLLNAYTDGAPYEEWCADFVSYVYKQAGYPFVNGEADGWDENVASDVQNQGFTQKSLSYQPAPGDVGYFDYVGGHVEIVISGGSHPTFIYGDSATIDPTTHNGDMEANTIMQDGNRGGITYYLTPDLD